MTHPLQKPMDDFLVSVRALYPVGSNIRWRQDGIGTLDGTVLGVRFDGVKVVISEYSFHSKVSFDAILRADQ